MSKHLVINSVANEITAVYECESFDQAVEAGVELAAEQMEIHAREFEAHNEYGSEDGEIVITIVQAEPWVVQTYREIRR